MNIFPGRSMLVLLHCWYPLMLDTWHRKRASTDIAVRRQEFLLMKLPTQQMRSLSPVHYPHLHIAIPTTAISPSALTSITQQDHIRLRGIIA